ncbi:MAG TPA: glycosyl hydrolase 53 family protein [Verrucomicrobiae bacterium]|nr:glycosyl hydrolase 53 family protein [Verrucomicrobiae bacterium]
MRKVFSRLFRFGFSGIFLFFISAIPVGEACAQTNFLAAADFSDLAFFESRGVTYKDNGLVTDGIQILKDHGINCVRLRLWTSSATQAAADPYNNGNNLAYTVPLAVRVKNAGLLFSLDFHYSDTWADPGHQATPDAWTNLNFTQLVAQMRSYNSNTVATFATAGAMPDFVQIGNEITSGMLFPDGQVSGTGGTPWSNLGQLMKAAIQGIEDATNALGVAMPKIIVHIDRGGDWSTTEWFFDNLKAQGVPYDIIGESYYPFFHGPLMNLNTCLSNAAIRYRKPIIVAEDAFPWTNTMTSWTNSLYGFAPTVTGQVSFLAALAKVVKSVPNGLGVGVFYWGAEYQASSGVNEAGFNTSSFFDTHGNLLPGADAVAGIGAPLVLSPSVTGTNLLLEWPFSGAASQLIGSTSLSGGALWSSITNPVSITGTVFGLTLPLSNSSGFYRLQSQ